MRPLLIAIVAFATNVLNAQDPVEIVRKADERMQGKSHAGSMKMTIVRPKWSREITMKSWAKGTDYSLVLITAPAREKGTGTLKREKEIWSWQPSIDRVIKLPPSMMMQSWMGSDFTNDDLVNQSAMVTDYTYELLGDTTVIGYDSWKIALYPKEETAVVWGKIEAYISKKDYYHLIFKYYDEDGYLVNSMYMSDVGDVGGRQIPKKMEMIPADNPDQKTVITYLDFQFDVELSDSFFSVQNLKTIR